MPTLQLSDKDAVVWDPTPPGFQKALRLQSGGFRLQGVWQGSRKPANRQPNSRLRLDVGRISDERLPHQVPTSVLVLEADPRHSTGLNRMSQRHQVVLAVIGRQRD